MILVKKISFTISLIAILFIVLIVSCKSPVNEHAAQQELQETEEENEKEIVAPNGTVMFGWTGTINRRIPVFLNFWYEGDLALGEIIYQDSPGKTPIEVYGRIGSDGELRLMEFERSGNISGIIKTIPTDQSLYGTWFSPKSRKEFPIALQRRESTKKIVDSKINISNIPGKYKYQYGPGGAGGELNVLSVKENTVEFNIEAHTGGGSPNLANVENAKAVLNGNMLIYKIPGSDDCEFKIEFFKRFASISYTQGNCNGEFGMNATVEGIFLKQ